MGKGLLGKDTGREREGGSLELVRRSDMFSTKKYEYRYERGLVHKTASSCPARSVLKHCKHDK